MRDSPGDGGHSPARAGAPSGWRRPRQLSRRGLLYAGLLLALLAALALAVSEREVIERHFIYFPDRDLVADPADVGLAFEEAYFDAEDGTRLHGWFVPGETDVAWLWFHGNAGNISHRLDNLRLLHDELAVSVFLFDYRGYGRSQGEPSEEGTYRDAKAALAYLRSRDDIDAERIVYFGRSLGAGVAVELATREPPFALILESPVPSIAELARHHYRYLPVGGLLRTKYDSLSKIVNVAAPLLVLHGNQDEVVPFEAGRKLYDAAASQPKRLYTIEGAGHNDTYLIGGQAYFRALRGFVEGLEP